MSMYVYTFINMSTYSYTEKVEERYEIKEEIFISRKVRTPSMRIFGGL